MYANDLSPVHANRQTPRSKILMPMRRETLSVVSISQIVEFALKCHIDFNINKNVINEFRWLLRWYNVPSWYFMNITSILKNGCCCLANWRHWLILDLAILVDFLTINWYALNISGSMLFGMCPPIKNKIARYFLFGSKNKCDYNDTCKHFIMIIISKTEQMKTTFKFHLKDYIINSQMNHNL